jgi:hypothetical protein
VRRDKKKNRYCYCCCCYIAEFLRGKLAGKGGGALVGEIDRYAMNIILCVGELYIYV